MGRPLVAEINLNALRHNYQLACQQSASAQALAVIKADAYGHGALKVAQALDDLAPAFAVACIEEAESLYTKGIRKPIVLLEGFFSSDELPLIHERQYPLVLHSLWQLQAMTHYFDSQHQGPIKPLQIWLKIDSGMHRLGFEPEQAQQVHSFLQQQPWVQEIILTSHLACADDLNNPYTELQLKRMAELQKNLGEAVSLANSPATLGWPSACEGWLRPGILLYGASPLPPDHPVGSQLKTVMTLKSQLISVRHIQAGEPVGYGGRFISKEPMQLGVIACGYGDGYPRQAIDGTPVWINGEICPLVGRVSMDMMTVDLTHLENPQPGDEVELWGPNLDVNWVARHCDTISYTLFTGLLPRVQRLYI